MRMMNDNVKITCTRDNYHHKYIQLRTYNLLSKAQYKVLSEIAKRKFVGTEERKEIREKLGMSVHSFNNVLSALKKRGLLVHDESNQMYSSRIEVPEEPGSLTFNFSMQ